MFFINEFIELKNRVRSIAYQHPNNEFLVQLQSMFEDFVSKHCHHHWSHEIERTRVCRECGTEVKIGVE